jgi:hypothetical protein
MPRDAQDELLYRPLQRQLGEIQVALRLTNSVLKDHPTMPGLNDAVQGLLKAKGSLFRRVVDLEGGE